MVRGRPTFPVDFQFSCSVLSHIQVNKTRFYPDGVLMIIDCLAYIINIEHLKKKHFLEFVHYFLSLKAFRHTNLFSNELKILTKGEGQNNCIICHCYWSQNIFLPGPLLVVVIYPSRI